MEKTMRQPSDTFAVAALLALAGGFLDAYTYLCRGGVFANAQTGNMVLLALRAAEGRWQEAAAYLAPILAFALGVLVTEGMRTRYRGQGRFHWRHWVLGVEILALGAAALIPVGPWNGVVNVTVSFVCALQVEAFRKVRGYPFASTMCTGNLRSGTEELWQFFATRQKQHLYHALNFYGGILAFMVGAAIGGLACPVLKEQAIWMACLPLVVVFSCLFFASFPTLQVDS